MEQSDLIIIGGGAGGLVVASGAAQLGLRVTLIESAKQLGGDCLHYGCVPSKTLIHTAKVAAQMRTAETVGLQGVAPVIDMAKINARIRDVIETIQVHDDPDRFRSYGCEVIFGTAQFTSPHSILVNGQTLHAKRFVIATGSRPAIPNIGGLAEAGYLTNETIFTLQALPRRLVVIGGGPVGLELGQAYARLGSEVTIVEALPRILAGGDPEISQQLREILEAEGLTIHTDSVTQRVTSDDQGKTVVCRNTSQEHDFSIEADAILVATGRQPQVEGLGLEAAGVTASRRGIEVDRRMRTSRSHIFACGDVCGPYALTHMADYQAGIIIKNVVFKIPAKADYSLVPLVTYTDPEAAQIGLTEQQAQDQGMQVEVVRVPFSDIDRAITEASTGGFIKLVARRGRLLGASILGPHGGELIHELALAIKKRAKLADIIGTIHAYPTLAQAHKRAAGGFYTKQLFSAKTRRLVKWLNAIVPW